MNLWRSGKTKEKGFELSGVVNDGKVGAPEQSTSAQAHVGTNLPSSLWS